MVLNASQLAKIEKKCIPPPWKCRSSFQKNYQIILESIRFLCMCKILANFLNKITLFSITASIKLKSILHNITRYCGYHPRSKCQFSAKYRFPLSILRLQPKITYRYLKIGNNFKKSKNSSASLRKSASSYDVIKHGGT